MKSLVILTVSVLVIAGCASKDAAQSLPELQTSASFRIPQKASRLPSTASYQATASYQDLLYVSSTAAGKLLVFSYPTLTLIGELTLSYSPLGLCSDSAGNVYVTAPSSGSSSRVYEYPHGGSESIKTLEDPGLANSCAVDPVSGDLAVANVGGPRPYGNGDIAVYKMAQGVPTTYFDPNVAEYFFCTYDNDGNLFADGSTTLNIINELPNGGRALMEINLTQAIEPASIQWYKSNLVAVGRSKSAHGKVSLYNVRVTGSSGAVTTKSLLWSPHDRNRSGVQLALSSGYVAGPGPANGGTGLVELWKFAKGGKAKALYKYPGSPDLYGAAISAANQ